MSDTFDLIVDMQYDFVCPNGELHVTGAEDIVEDVQRFINGVTAEETAGILFTMDTHIDGVYQESEEAKEFKPHCLKGFAGWRLVINPYNAKVPIYTLKKGVFDMWKESSLRVVEIGTTYDRDEFFENLKHQGVKKLRVRGVAADYCVKLAIDGAIERGFEVEVIIGQTRGIDRRMGDVVREDFAGQMVTCI